jgi:hypothetical protein
MFRPNRLLLRQCRMILYKRSYCEPKPRNPKEKCYIINTKDHGKKIVYESQIIKDYCDRTENQLVCRDASLINWNRLIVLAREMLTKGRNFSSEVIRRLEVNEKITKLKQSMIEMLATRIDALKQKLTLEQIKQLPGHVKAGMEVVKQSNMWINIQNYSSQAYANSKLAKSKIHHYWCKFLKSDAKNHLMKILLWTWVNGKALTGKFSKFIYEAYFQEPQPLKIKRKKMLKTSEPIAK